MPRTSTRDLNHRPSGGERVFTDALGRLWSAASHVEGDTVTLFDVQVGKMLGHRDALKKISETAKTDRDAAKAEFSKLDGIRIETKEDVTITLK